MKINDILKEENAGKVYIIKNKGWEGTKQLLPVTQV